MPSDDRIQGALDALAGPREAFLSAVSTSVGQVRNLLRERGPSEDGRNGRAAAELGPFAAGRIDVERFGALFEGEELLEAGALDEVRRALEALEDVAGGGDELFVVRVEAGDDPAPAIADALAATGRAFGAARAVELIRIGRFNTEIHGDYALRFPVDGWNRAERRIAPPLVVEVDGGALRGGALAPFLDGAQKLVLVLRGEAPPAPLAGLITPGVAVAQVGDPSELGAPLDFDGPAVAAVVPSGAARFVHDPEGGPTLRERLVVDHLPEEDPGRPVGRATAFRQREELGQLRALVGEPGAVEPAGPEAPPGRPDDVTAGDRLAAWLLDQADLSDLG